MFSKSQFSSQVVKCRITLKGFAMAGLRKTKLSINTKLSKNHFRFFKITKNKKTKWFFAAEKAKIFNARELRPRFCKTDVVGSYCFSLINFNAYSK